MVRPHLLEPVVVVEPAVGQLHAAQDRGARLRRLVEVGDAAGQPERAAVQGERREPRRVGAGRRDRVDDAQSRRRRGIPQPVVADPPARRGGAGVGEDPGDAVAGLGRAGEDDRPAAPVLAQVRPPPRHRALELVGQDTGRHVRTAPGVGTQPGEHGRGPHVAPGEMAQRLGDELLDPADARGRPERVGPHEVGVGEQVRDDRAAGDRGDRAEPPEDPELVEPADGAEVEEGGPEAAAREAQRRPGAGTAGRGSVVRGGPGRLQLGRGEVGRGRGRVSWSVVEHPATQPCTGDGRMNTAPTCGRPAGDT